MKHLLFIFFISSTFAFGQDSIPALDSVKPHSIRKALILSAVLPGAGQVYNHMAMPKGQKKAYWKVPLIYAGLGTTSYFLIRNQLEQKRLKQEYSNREDPLYVYGTDYPDLASYDNDGILTLYNQYLNWRDLSILAVGAVYLFQLADAGVEAHFVSFDVSEDLSISMDPIIMGFRTPGVSLRLNFH